jgi:glycosyltransferase involved in cell wall biosynthesis
MKISIVIPAYNEEGTILNTIDEVEKYLVGYSSCSWWEIIVVNDGSSDQTLNKLKNYQQEKPWLRVSDLVVNMGRGAALRNGIALAQGEIIVSLDADLSYAPYHIERMVKKLVEEQADMVLASAYRQDGTVKNVPKDRLFISKVGNKILSHMYGGSITVLTCIARAYRKDFIQGLDLHSNTKDIHLEILYKGKILGAKILEVPADLAWAPKKIEGLSKSPKRRSTLKFRKTSSSHFFFALINKPGLVFVVPGMLLFIFSILVVLYCFYAMRADLFGGMTILVAARKSMVETATASWLISVFAFLLSIQFFSLGFLTNQSKWNYEETYRTNNAILRHLKDNK